MISDQELKQKFKVFVEENNIANLTFIREELDPAGGARLAELVEQDILDILNKNPQKNYDSIIDFTLVREKVSNVSEEARKIYARIMFHEQIRNIAIVGSDNIFYKAVIGLISKINGRHKKIKWFSCKVEAIKWLKGEE